jgi:hypothetical protein
MMQARPKPKFTTPGEITERAMALAAVPGKSFYDLARDLATLHAHQPSVVTKIGTANGHSARRMHYLFEVGQFIQKTGISKDVAERVGWTKLSIIARHTKDADSLSGAAVSALIALAKQSTAHNLPDALAQNAAPATADRAILLHLTPDQYEVVEAALIAFGAKRKGRGLAGKEVALAAMARAVNKRRTMRWRKIGRSESR